MRAVCKRAAPYCDSALNLPVENVDSAIPFYETIMGFQVVLRKDAPYKLSERPEHNALSCATE
jgi:lactoylglutathione lyase